MTDEKKKNSKKKLKSFIGVYRYILPYKTPFIIGTILLLLSSLTSLSFPFFTGKLVDSATGNNSWILKDINSIALALLGIFIIQAVLAFWRVYLFAQVSEKSMADIRLKVYEKLITMPLTFYDTQRVGELTSRISSDVGSLQSLISSSLAEFFRQIITLIAGITIVLITSPQLSLFMLAVFPVLIIAAMIFGKYIRKLSKKTQDELGKSNTVVEETLQSIHTVKSFTNELFETKRYRSSLMQTIKVALQSAFYRSLFVSFVILAIFGSIVLVIWYGAGLVASHSISIGSLFSFVIYTTFIGASVGGLGDLYSELQRSMGASDRIREILDSENESVSLIGKEEEQGTHFTGKIEYKNLSFAYPTRQDVQVLKNINLSIQPGEKIALVGHSGAGKSTFVQLLLRFYPVSEGFIQVDDTPIDQFSLTTYRKNIGIVPQEVLLFGGTIRENIAYGKPTATEDEIIEAAKKAYAYDFIQSFPEGLHTLVGERGIKLSGGQRQRIAIARAILKNPAILILDEATSSLDAESEHLVQEALNELMKNRTTIIIAHRLSTIRKVDRIYVLDQGAIVEEGTHEILSKKTDGIYQYLLKLQFSLPSL